MYCPLPTVTASDRLTANVRELLVFVGRTQVELAAHLGISQPQASLLLHGKRPWQVKDFDQLAAFFCVSVGDLFNEGHGRHERRAGKDRRCGPERRRRIAPAVRS